MDQETRELHHAKLRAEAKRFEAEARQFNGQADLIGLQFKREQEKEAIEDAENPRRGTFHFVGEVKDVTMFQTMRLVERYARLEPRRPVEMLITSPGGSVVHGLAIYDRVLGLRAEGAEINTHALGIAGSIAGVMLQAGERRLMGRESWLMIHEASLQVEGTTSEVEDTTNWLEKIHDRIIEIYMARAKAGLTRKQFEAKWKRKAWWIPADEAVKLGFADEVR